MKHINPLKTMVSLLVVFLLCFVFSPVWANTITVTNNSDSNAGSLRQAIADAASGDTITFDANYHIYLASELSIAKNLTITGTGAGSTIIDGNNSVRVFNITSGTVFLENMTIQNGNAVGSGTTYLRSGSGIWLQGGELTINSCTVTSNLVDSNNKGAGIYNEGGTMLTINNSTISNNNSAGIGGGIAHLEGQLNINNSLISNNNAAGGFGGGVYLSSSDDATINNSTIYGNTATTTGGGIIFYNGTFNINNCTFADNHSDNDNSGDEKGGGIYLGSGTLNIRNTIIANNYRGSGTATGDDYYYVSGTLNDYGYNVVEYQKSPAGPAGLIKNETDILYNVIIDPLSDNHSHWNINSVDIDGSLNLSISLADNGGPTQTLALASDSFAAASETTGIPPASNWNNSPEYPTGHYTDQRGVARTADQNTSIGAYSENYVVAAITWDGSESSDWTDGDNWSSGSVPGADDDVVIPDAGTTDNDPSVNGAYTLDSFSVQDGGVVNFTAADSQITADEGVISITGTGESANGALIAAGSNQISLLAQAVNITLAGAKIVSSSGDVTISSTGGTVQVTGSASINSTAGAVTLNSDGGDIGGGGSLAIGAGTGTASVQDPVNGLTNLTISSASQVDLANVSVTTGSIAVTGTNIDLNGDTYTSTEGSVTFTGAVDLDSAGGAAVTSGGGSGDNIFFTSTIDGKNDNTQSLTLDSGASGTVSVSGAIGGTESKQIKTLTITNSNGATFGGGVSADTSVVLTDTTDSADIIFNGALVTPTLTTANQGYDVQLNGDGTSFTNLVEFLNTGTVNFGDTAGDTLTFTGGIETSGNASNPSSTIFNGTLATSNDTVELGTTTITGDITIDPAGGGVEFQAVTINDGKTLTVGTGDTGIIYFNSTINSEAGGNGHLTINTDSAAALGGHLGDTRPLGTITLTNGSIQMGSISINAGTIIVNGGTFGVAPLPVGDWNVDNITIASGATLNATSGTFNVSGNWTGNGTFTAGTGTVTFTGAANSTLSGTSPNTFYNLSLNKDETNDSLVFTSGDTVTVENNMTITRGMLDLGTWTHNLLLGGALTIGTNGRWTKHGSLTQYVEFYDTDCTYNDATGSQNLGHVKIDE